MSQHSRLERLLEAHGAPARRPEVRASPSALAQAATAWGATLEETPFGPVVARTLEFPAGTRRGGVRLDTLEASLPPALPLLVRPAPRVPTGGAVPGEPESGEHPGCDDVRDAGGWAVLDTETTGLGGGAGVFAFLVGIGLFGPERGPAAFTVRQYLATEPGMERALLWKVDRALEGRSGLITFNGKAFDLPLLEGRRILARQPARWRPDVHLDLRHAAGRLWRDALPDTTLRTLEAAVLGHVRDDDIPGALIPTTYFTFLRTGDPAPMAPVLQHNAEDVVSLTALAGRVARWVTHSRVPGGGGVPSGAGLGSGTGEWLGLARVCAAACLWGDAAACARHALDRPGSEATRERAAALLAVAYRRLGRPAGAPDAWRTLSAGPDATSVALVEWAKHCEHRARDPDAALAAARRALDRAERLSARGVAGVPPDCTAPALRHRLARLEKKRRRMASRRRA